MQIDTSTEHGQRAEQRLRDEQIIWLTTVRGDGQPVPIPIWFYWDGDTVLMYSQPDTPKLRNIRNNPNVSLNFDSDGTGGNIVQFDGEATVKSGDIPANEATEMMEKYARGLVSIDMTPESYADAFSVPIRVTLKKMRGH